MFDTPWEILYKRQQLVIDELTDRVKELELRVLPPEDEPPRWSIRN